MPHEWILEVLADLRDYARANGLPFLADDVQRTLLAAQAELARVAAGEKPEGAPATQAERY